MDASPGVAPVPAPVEPNVNDEDIALMWDVVQKQRFGVLNPTWLVLGTLFIASDILSLTFHGGVRWWSVALGVCYVALAFTKAGANTATLRPFEVTFSNFGMIVEMPGTILVKSLKSYSWRSICRVDDMGDSLVIIPWFKQRIVLPKRSFPDRGREAWAFFAAHGVAGRIMPAQPAAVIAV